MGALFQKWNGMISEGTTGLTATLALVAVLAIIVVVVLAVVTHDDKEKAAKVKNLIGILIFCSVGAVAGALASWALS